MLGAIIQVFLVAYIMRLHVRYFVFLFNTDSFLSFEIKILLSHSMLNFRSFRDQGNQCEL